MTLASIFNQIYLKEKKRKTANFNIPTRKKYNENNCCNQKEAFSIDTALTVYTLCIFCFKKIFLECY